MTRAVACIRRKLHCQMAIRARIGGFVWLSSGSIARRATPARRDAAEQTKYVHPLTVHFAVSIQLLHVVGFPFTSSQKFEKRETDQINNSTVVASNQRIYLKLQ